MSIIQAIIGTNLTISAGGGGGGGGGVSPDGTHFNSSIYIPWGAAGTAKPLYTSLYNLPDGQTTDQVWDFNGVNQWMTTQANIGYTQFYMNVWFYPTNNGRILMTIQDTLTGEGVSYHHSALEINSNNTVSGKFWANGYLTTANTVTLNQWNHIYFRHNGTQTFLQLNGGTAVTANNSWSYPSALVLGFGTTSATNNGNSGRYQGLLSRFEMSSVSMLSNYDSTRTQYETPQVFLYDDFTIEWWQKAEANGRNSRPWAIGLLGSASGQEISLSYEGNGRDYFWINDGFPAQQEYRPLKNHYTNSWEHMAIVRKDGEVKLYSNGSNYMTWPYANQAITALNADLVVGTGEISNGHYQGYIKDLHIIKGYAKYTTNFLVPTSPTQPETGSVFLLPAMTSGTALDDTVGGKLGTPTNTPTYSEDDPWTFPTQSFTAFAYGGDIVAMNPPYPTGLTTGLRISDQHGWSDYIKDLSIPGHIRTFGSIPTYPAGTETYTVEEVTAPLTININYAGTGGGVSIIEGRVSQYPATAALSAVKSTWTYLDPNGGTGMITNNAYIVGDSVELVVHDDILGTWTFTPPVRGGSLYFDTGDYINYGSSVDWAMDVDGIATANLTLNLDANNPASYSGTGSTWADLSVGNFPFTLYGSPYYTAGSQSSLNFNGTTQYATGPAVNMLPDSEYTKMVWFKLNTLNADNNLVSSDGGGHYMFFSGGNKLYAGHSNVPPYQGPGAFGSIATFTTDTWYCATVTYSVANGISIYVNGQLDNNTAMIAHTGNGSTNLACFGAGGNLLNGKLGRVLCYSRELTAQEVLNNFNATRNRYGI